MVINLLKGMSMKSLICIKLSQPAVLTEMTTRFLALV